MRVAVYSSHPYDEEYLSRANDKAGHDLVFLESRLKPRTAKLADGFDAVCAFVNDDLSAPVLEALDALGIRRIALRSAGFNHVDLEAAGRLGFTVARVPAYSPHAVAEHTVAMMLALNRQIHKAYTRVRDGNFALDGLLGFDTSGPRDAPASSTTTRVPATSTTTQAPAATTTTPAPATTTTTNSKPSATRVGWNRRGLWGRSSIRGCGWPASGMAVRCG